MPPPPQVVYLCKIFCVNYKYLCQIYECKIYLCKIYLCKICIFVSKIFGLNAFVSNTFLQNMLVQNTLVSNIFVQNIFVCWTIGRYWVPKPTPVDGINFVTFIDGFVSDNWNLIIQPSPSRLHYIFDFQVLKSLENTFSSWTKMTSFTTSTFRSGEIYKTNIIMN